MEILYGLASGMVMQRGEDNTCDILIGIKAPSVVVASTGSLREIGINAGIREFRLTGIPVGGPYTLTLSSGFERLDFEKLYVGDVWMLSGQSNMVGFSRYNEESRHLLRDDTIRLFYPSDLWFAANALSHCEWTSEEHMFAHVECGEIVAPKKIYPGGVGPGYYLLREMKRLTGVPQGAISVAVGGTGMWNWEPGHTADDRGSLYGNMMHGFRAAGSHIRGMFWYQGCTDAMENGAPQYEARMREFLAAVRQDFRNPALPIVMYQIFTYQANEKPEVADAFSVVREVQRKLALEIPNLDTVSTLGSVTDDSIHLSADSHRRLAPLAAESMAHLCYDPQGIHTKPAPRPGAIECEYRADEYNTNVIRVKFENLYGDLQSNGIATGFALSRSPERVDTHYAFRVYLKGDTAVIQHAAPRDELEKMYLWYAYGCDLHANISDAHDRPIPAFGPIPLSGTLIEKES